MTKRKNPWLQVFYYSLVLMVLFGVYYMFQAQDFKLINIVIKSMTNVGMFMVGQSLFIGPLGKFWDRFDKYIHYRKMLGVLGYYYLLLHAVFAMILYVLPRGTYSTLTLFSLGFGLTGLFLFHFCTEISDIDTIRSMGANAWRRTLRYLSYGGFIAGLIHIIISRWKWEWAPYLTESQKNVCTTTAFYTGSNLCRNCPLTPSVHLHLRYFTENRSSNPFEESLQK
jgi:DMSO/TMAO reductase YedYZ heme-binding membrane subunit